MLCTLHTESCSQIDLDFSRNRFFNYIDVLRTAADPVNLC